MTVPFRSVPRLVWATALLLAGLPVWAPAAQSLTYTLAPYDLAKANWTAANYLQALISPRWEAVAFAHDRFGAADGLGGLYFIDDQGRVIWSFAREAEFGPVARVDAVAAMARGILRARILGSQGRYFFVLDGRQSLYLRPEADRVGAYWLQDSSTAFCSLDVAAAEGEQWTGARFEPVSRAPEVFDAETTYEGRLGADPIRLRSFAGVYDQAPVLEVQSAGARRVRIRLVPTGDQHYLWLGSRRRSAMDGPVTERPQARWLLLEHDARLSRSDKTGWEAPALWSPLNSMVLVTWDAPADTLAAEPRDGAWPTVELTWRGVTALHLRIAVFLDLDPGDCSFVFRAAEHVARDGHFGCRPYLPVRTSNSFMGAVLGLCAAARLLTEYHHPDAAKVRGAAVEALRAVIASEERGVHGERTNQAILAAYDLKAIAPGALDYDRWVRVWADRDLQRCPPGWRTPPWSDTAQRAIRGWRYAAMVTGDSRYLDACRQAMQEFDLPPPPPWEAFSWRGQAHPFDGYDCTAAAMLLGEWGQARDPRAGNMIREAGERFVCDLGFTPLRTWTCDDLLPYHVGYSLPAVYGDHRAAPRRLSLDQYAMYDDAGKVQVIPRPALPTPP